MAADMIEFPEIYLIREHSLSISKAHRYFSSERPEVSFLALSNFISHCLMSLVSFYLLAIHSLYLL